MEQRTLSSFVRSSKTRLLGFTPVCKTCEVFLCFLAIIFPGSIHGTKDIAVICQKLQEKEVVYIDQFLERRNVNDCGICVL